MFGFRLQQSKQRDQEGWFSSGGGTGPPGGCHTEESLSLTMTPTRSPECCLNGGVCSTTDLLAVRSSTGKAFIPAAIHLFGLPFLPEVRESLWTLHWQFKPVTLNSTILQLIMSRRPVQYACNSLEILDFILSALRFDLFYLSFSYT